MICYLYSNNNVIIGDFFLNWIIMKYENITKINKIKVDT